MRADRRFLAHLLTLDAIRREDGGRRNFRIPYGFHLAVTDIVSQFPLMIRAVWSRP